MDLKDHLESTAVFRDNRASQFPNDTRNATAAELLRNLASQAMSEEVSAAFEAAVADYEDVCVNAPQDMTIDNMVMAEHRAGETLRSIGFTFHPKALDEVAVEVTGDIELGTESVREAIKAA